MTGYASAQLEAAGPDRTAPSLGLELRSVNSRFLDLALRLPEDLRMHEPALRALLSAGLRRGKVELRAHVEMEDGALLTEPPAQLLEQMARVQQAVRAVLPDAAPFRMADVLRLGAGAGPSRQDLGPALLALARRALDELSEARAREGARLAQMLRERVQQLRSLAEQAGPLVPQLVQQQRERFLERWREAMQLAEGAAVPEAAQERALTEATAYAIRIDVAEELTRLVAHLDEIERLLARGGEVGKRLDFLIQELHREANTLGSKSATMELTRIGVDMKVLIEQMREQVQNLE